MKVTKHYEQDHVFLYASEGSMVTQVTQLERDIRYMVLNTMYKGMPEFEIYFDHKRPN